VGVRTGRETIFRGEKSAYLRLEQEKSGVGEAPDLRASVECGCVDVYQSTLHGTPEILTLDDYHKVCFVAVLLFEHSVCLQCIMGSTSSYVLCMLSSFN
jgi:hypothetical protein